MDANCCRGHCWLWCGAKVDQKKKKSARASVPWLRWRLAACRDQTPWLIDDSSEVASEFSTALIRFSLCGGITKTTLLQKCRAASTTRWKQSKLAPAAALRRDWLISCRGPDVFRVCLWLLCFALTFFWPVCCLFIGNNSLKIQAPLRRNDIKLALSSDTAIHQISSTKHSETTQKAKRRLFGSHGAFPSDSVVWHSTITSWAHIYDPARQRRGADVCLQSQNPNPESGRSFSASYPVVARCRLNAQKHEIYCSVEYNSTIWIGYLRYKKIRFI